MWLLPPPGVQIKLLQGVLKSSCKVKGCFLGPVIDPNPDLSNVAVVLQQNIHSSPARFIFKHPLGKRE